MYITLSCRASCWPSSCVTCKRQQSLSSRVLQAGLHQYTLHVKDPAPSNNNAYLDTAQFSPCPGYTAGKLTCFKGIFCNRQRLTLQEIPPSPGAFTSVLYKTKFSFTDKQQSLAPPQSKCFSQHMLGY